MISPSYLLAVIFISIQGSCGEIVMTQTPDSISVSPGQTVTMTCTSSTSITNMFGSWVAWYQQKHQQPPKLLIDGSTRQSGIPDRFSGSGSGTELKLTINGATADDDAKYYCQQSMELPYSFGGGTTVEIKRRENAKPTVHIFRPSLEQIISGSASSVCLVDQFYPGDCKVEWKADNNVITNGVETSDKIKDTDSTYSLSSTLTMTSEEFKKYNIFTCVVTHATLTPALATSFKASECTV